MTGHARRECQSCLSDRLYSPREARRVLDLSGWDRRTVDALDRGGAELVCGYCRAVREGGTWSHPRPPHERAEELARVGPQDAAEYFRRMTEGREGSDA